MSAPAPSASVSIGLPTFNHSDLLRGALDSLLAQTHRDIEVVVVDNASTDSTPEVVRRYQELDPRVRYVRQPTHVPALSNFSTAVHTASGPLFAWAADDDRWHPDFVRVLADAVMSEGLGGAFSWSYDVHWDSPTWRVTAPVTRLPAMPSSNGRARNLVTWQLAPYHSCIYGLFRRDLLLSVDALCDPDRFVDFEPFDAYVVGRALLHAPYRIVEEPLYYRGVWSGRPAKHVDPGRDVHAVVRQLTRSIRASPDLSALSRFALPAVPWVVQLSDDIADRSWLPVRRFLAPVARAPLFLARAAMRRAGWISPMPPPPRPPFPGIEARGAPAER